MRKHGLACDKPDRRRRRDRGRRVPDGHRGRAPRSALGASRGRRELRDRDRVRVPVHPVGVVQTATLMWPAEQGGDVLRLYREFSDTEPEDLTTFLFFLDAPAGPFLPSKLHGKPLVAIAACHLGSPEEARKALAPLFEFGPPLTGEVAPHCVHAAAELLRRRLARGLRTLLEVRLLRPASRLGDRCHPRILRPLPPPHAAAAGHRDARRAADAVLRARPHGGRGLDVRTRVQRRRAS
jgi:hypothetical protein